MKQSLIGLLALACASFVCCDKPFLGEITLPAQNDSISITAYLKQSYTPVSSDAQSLENKITSLSAYLFQGEDLVQVFDGLKGDVHTLKFTYAPDRKSHLYFIANGENLPEVGQIKVRTTKWSDFMKIKSSSAATAEPGFLILSGSVDLTSEDLKTYEVRMNRGMSRVDLLLSAPEVAIRKVTICNTQNEGYVFSQTSIASPTYSNIERNFKNPATTSMSEVAYINEQRHDKLSALVEYTCKDVKAVLTLKLPNIIERNSTCQIIVERVADGKVVGSVRVVDWAVGDDQTTTPDTDYKIKIDALQSTLPDGALLSSFTNSVDFPRNGGEAILYFTGTFDKDINVISADPRLDITPINTLYRNSALKINATQTLESGAYSVKIRVSKAYIPNDLGTEITINVASMELDHVVMGGLKWLMVNGIGPDFNLYPLLEEGQTARDFYKKHWKDHTAMTVWGPRPAGGQLPQLWPWQSATTTDTGGGAIFGDNVVSWLPTHDNLPCPKGWRLPTIDECKRIWPTGSANKSYTMNGVDYRCSIEDSGHPDILLDGTTTTAPTKIFVISDGKQDLIFPIAGWRRADVTTPAHAVEIGIYLNLWVMNRGNNGYSTPTFGVRGDLPYISSVGGDADWVMANAYKNSRCVKDL